MSTYSRVLMAALLIVTGAVISVSTAIGNAPEATGGPQSATPFIHNPGQPGEAAEVMPGEVVVQLTPEASRTLSMNPALAERGRTGMPQIDARLASIDATKIAPVFRMDGDVASKTALGMDRFYLVHFAGGQDPSEAVRRLGQVAGVVLAEPNGIAHALYTPNDTFYPSQWAHNNTGQASKYGGGTCGTVDCDMDTDTAWDWLMVGSWPTIAILDTGVDTGHPEFTNGQRLLAGYDFINNDSVPADDYGHGTCCAGIALAAFGNAQGIAGVTRDAYILPVKVLGSTGSGTWTQIASGISWAADRAKILSMSLGGAVGATVLQTAVNYAYGKGCAIFCAAGNNDMASLLYPAAYENTIAVGALSPCNERKNPSSCDGETWWGSNYGTGLDFLAPGVRIYTTDIRGTGGFATGDYYSTFNGTSAATPHAAGVAALVWHQNPYLTNAQLRTMLDNSCDDLANAPYAPGWDRQTGYGRLNAYNAVRNVTPRVLFSDGFENGTVPGSAWLATDLTSTCGLDYWGDETTAQGARVYNGTKSCYCAQNSDVVGQKYDNYMDATLTMNANLNVSGYCAVKVMFWMWYQTANSSDYVALQYLSGSTWIEQQRWYGSSTNWVNPTFVFTGFTNFQIRFLFHSDSQTTAEGVYIDNVRIDGYPKPGGGGFAPPEVPTVVAVEGQEGMSENGMPALAKDAIEDELIPQSKAPADATADAATYLRAVPNPFNPRTEISFSVPRQGHVRVEVVGVDGRVVKVLHDAITSAGSHSVIWSGNDLNGRSASSGVYFARVVLNGMPIRTARLLMIK